MTRYVLILSLLCTLLLAGCLPPVISTSAESPTAVTTVPANSPAAAPLQVYFTDPYSKTEQGGPAGRILQAVSSAQSSIDIAMYSFSLEDVTQALLRAAGRGVRVRLVIDNDSLDKSALKKLRAAGIPIHSDKSNTLMHNKFSIFDQQQVCTGSLNLTKDGAYHDHNVLLCATDVRLAKIYTAEFEEMYSDGRFGAASPAGSAPPPLSIGGRAIEVYFSPEDHVADRLLTLIRGARKSVDMLAYSFTLNNLSDALRERVKAGAAVRVVFDSDHASQDQGGEYPRLKKAGLDVRRDSLPGLMHEKVIILDGETVVVGSFNFTSNANTDNDENVLVIHDAAMAGQFLAEFERIYKKSKP